MLSAVTGSMELTALVSYLDSYLRVAAVPDAPHAVNGLQVANTGTVSRVAAAVDLCEATVRMAAEQGADLLLVHHGLFWGGLQPLTGRAHRRVAGLIAKNIALYSAHLPLDLHPEVGNNAVLARQLGVSLRGEFGEEYGVRIGRWGEVDVSRDALERQLAALTGSAPRLMAFGPQRVRRVGVVTGAAGSMIAQAAAADLDTFVTGEGPHHTFFDAEELKLNVFYAGHYATETVGVKALAEHLHVRFRLPWTFLDHPTGL
jgi:dinuclear metal center YbgI/SA1388 family protein